MNKKLSLVMVSLGLGTAAMFLWGGRVGAQVPPAAAPAQRWDHDCEQTHGVEEARTIARARGEAGWELVALDAGVMCFKRPLPAPPKPPDPWPGY